MSSIHRWLLPLAVTLAFAAPVSAQWKPVAEAGQVRHFSSTSATMPAPDLGAMSGGVVPAVEAAAATYVVPPLPGVERTSRDVALMIVGGTALILGAVIGDDAGAFLMVGGAVVGLVGLYQYLR